MPTKAELEAELAALRSELTAFKDAREQRIGAGEINDGRQPPENAENVESSSDAGDQGREDLGKGLREIAAEFEAAAESHPAIALIGVFVAGLIIGRLMAR